MASITYRALWRWHFHAGLFCIPFVIVLALTGSIYLFKPQIDAFADRNVDSLQLTGHRASGEAQIAAAIASLPGSRLFVYEIPREPDDAVRVHLYAPDGTGRIVAILVEAAASGAIVMIITGLYLWWPRDARALAGTLYPRLGAGSQV